MALTNIISSVIELSCDERTQTSSLQQKLTSDNQTTTKYEMHGKLTTACGIYLEKKPTSTKFDREMCDWLSV